MVSPHALNPVTPVQKGRPTARKLQFSPEKAKVLKKIDSGDSEITSNSLQPRWAVCSRSIGDFAWKQAGLDERALHRYNACMVHAVEEGVVAGCASLVIKGGQVVHRAEYGWADIEKQTPFTADTICRLYCSTKSFVACAIMILLEEGKVGSVDDPVSKYIPAFGSLQVAEAPTSAEDNYPKRRRKNATQHSAVPRPVQRTMTLRHLLTHTSGLGYGADFGQDPDATQVRYTSLVEGVAQGRICSLAQFVDELAVVPLLSEPGTKKEYSYSVDVLGRVVEVASGKRLDRFLKKRLFEPLGMPDTCFAVPKDKFGRLAVCYGSASTLKMLVSAKAEPSTTKLVADGEGLGKGGKLVRIDGSTPEESAWAEGHRLCPVLSGGGLLGHNSGGCVSTIQDMEHFMRFLLCRGEYNGKQLLQASTVEMMMEDWIPIVRQQAAEEAVKRGRSIHGSSAASKKRKERAKAVEEPQHGEEEGDSWSVLGQMFKHQYKGGLKRGAATIACGQGGAASTSWTVNLSEDLAILWFAQLVDDLGWDDLKDKDMQDIWTVVKKGFSKKKSSKISD
eukprot:gnl/MRDRNA2_/MRDRNA2_90024_c0_seq1.p1 gnl/MRDRNA2_/MRDRNA2_90024_c0~~gnl/MRDRNA2_/MRDRNA2_90024_c0_seq1.p1  ORF type:complete len:562 (-),score=117.04 gnl/MRDRNA2_/MRDRNA2_90024_c0_seq1:234-1919(-)